MERNEEGLRWGREECQRGEEEGIFRGEGI